MGDYFNYENNKLALNIPIHQTSIVSLLYEQYFSSIKFYSSSFLKLKFAYFFLKPSFVHDLSNKKVA